MRSLTRAALSLIVAGASTAFTFGQTPTPGGAPGNTPTGTSGAPATGAQPGVQPGGATPAQTPRPGGVSPTAPGTIAPAPGTIAPTGTGAATPGQPGAPQANPIPGQPGAPTTTTPVPGQPGAPQTVPVPGQPGSQQIIPGQPGATAPRPGAQPGQPTQNQIVPGTTINQGTTGVPQPAQGTPGTGTTGTAQPAAPGTGTTGTGVTGTGTTGVQPGAAGVNGTAQLQANGNVNLGGFGNFGMGATSPFFADQSLRNSLNLSNQQFGTLNDSFSRMMTDFRTGVDRLDGNLSAADRTTRTQELWNNLNTQFMTGAGKTLNAEQQGRFRQLALQFQGVDAFRDPTVQKTLNLSDDQQSHMRSIREAFQKQVAGIGQLGQTNATEANQRWTALQKEMATRINGVLTADQQKQWAQLIGDPFTFSLNMNANANAGTNQNP